MRTRKFSPAVKSDLSVVSKRRIPEERSTDSRNDWSELGSLFSCTDFKFPICWYGNILRDDFSYANSWAQQVVTTSFSLRSV